MGCRSHWGRLRLCCGGGPSEHRAGPQRALTTEDEAADGGNEAAEEGVEGEGADAEAVAELQRAGEQHVQEVGVQHLEAARRAAAVDRKSVV